MVIQSGFLPGSSTTEQIVALRSIIDSCYSHHRSVSIIFVDFSKAFDSISREAIPIILQFYGVPAVLIDTIMDLYRNTTACVRTSHGNSNIFTTTSGVLQGDTLAPLLFIIILDYVLRRALCDEEDSYILRPRMCSRQPCVRLSALAYADDIALLCSGPEAALRTLTRLHNEGLKVGLKISAKKTEVMHIGTSTSPNLQLPSGEQIKTCEDFKYLGAQMLSPDKLFAERRAQAWRAANNLRPIFHSEATDQTKIRLFRATVEPILAYSLEAVPITETRAKMINASYRRLLRYSLGIHFPDTVSNNDLKRRTNIPDFTDLLRRRRLSLLGHTLREDARRMCNEEPRIPLALVLDHPPVEPFRRGKANMQSLMRTYEDDMNYLGLTKSQICTIQKDDYRSRVLSL